VRYLLVINTRAGGLRGAGWGSSAEAGSRRILAAFPGSETLMDPTPEALARGCARAGPDTVTVVAGGDGTVNRVLQARCARRAGRLAPHGRLAVLPAGTANDLAGALGMPGGWEPAAAAIRDAVRAGHTRRIDLLTVNGRPFVTCGGLGAAADAAARVGRWRERGGPAGRAACAGLRWAAYPLAAAVEFLGPRRLPRARIECEGRAWNGELLALLVSNQPRFGRRFEASPGAAQDDGMFDVCQVDAPRGRARMFHIMARTLRGGAQGLSEVRQFQARSLTVETELPARFFGDGEILEIGRRFEIAIHPGALEVVAPESLAAGTTEPLHAGGAR
jgi:diacylglycerol kinase (ATP)